MPKWRERECLTCHEIAVAASKSEICLPCYAKNKKGSVIDREKQIIADYVYLIEGEPIANKFGKRVYRLIPPCCENSWETVFGNLMSGIKKNEQSGYNKLPCATCGGQARMAKALRGYEARHGKDYDQMDFDNFHQLVRKLSNQNYKLHKDIINPNNYIRGLNHDYHMDHVVSIKEAFELGWSAEKTSAVPNLQMLPWRGNISKGSR